MQISFSPLGGLDNKGSPAYASTKFKIKLVEYEMQQEDSKSIPMFFQQQQ